ncbi:putative glucan 1,3-alpha-glucosidase [Cocos nucifera]|uniref:Putative glucan 1,3-alpha-glucosidase n=1 Tax=Cocos nucifera TaxID=13894 RepID=A0A8K0ITV4_COCNU|nr:putative glucan 1,3-alpha-glucosidase [Cocos nucifera]
MVHLLLKESFMLMMAKAMTLRQGAYIHRRFIFADRKLTSTDVRSANFGGKFSSDRVIERIILLRLPSGAKKAVIEPGNREADVELGPLTLRGGSSLVAVTVRKPNVRIADDWTLRIP